jgi:hypothetical protein
MPRQYLLHSATPAPWRENPSFFRRLGICRDMYCPMLGDNLDSGVSRTIFPRYHEALYSTRLPAPRQINFRLRASPAVPPTQPPDAIFYIWTVIFGPAAPPVPRFRPDLGFHPSGEPRPSPTFRGVLGDSGRNKNAQNSERARGVGERKGSSPPLILFPSKMRCIYPFSPPKSPTVAAPPLLFHHHAAEEDRR